MMIDVRGFKVEHYRKIIWIFNKTNQTFILFIVFHLIQFHKVKYKYRLIHLITE